MSALIAAILCAALALMDVCIWAFADGGPLALAMAAFCGLCAVLNAIMAAAS